MSLIQGINKWISWRPPLTMTEWASSSRNSPRNVWLCWELRTQDLPDTEQGVLPEEAQVKKERALLTLASPADFTFLLLLCCCHCLAVLREVLPTPIWPLNFSYPLPLTRFPVSPPSPLTPTETTRTYSLPTVSCVLWGLKVGSL